MIDLASVRESYGAFFLRTYIYREDRWKLLITTTN